MLLPSVTGLGEAELVTAMSAWPAGATTAGKVALLLFGFGSGVEAETSAVSVIEVPEAVPALTCTTTVNVAVALTASAGVVQVRFPAATEQLHPPGIGVSETKVVLAGIASLKVIPVAAA